MQTVIGQLFFNVCCPFTAVVGSQHNRDALLLHPVQPIYVRVRYNAAVARQQSIINIGQQDPVMMPVHPLRSNPDQRGKSVFRI